MAMEWTFTIEIVALLASSNWSRESDQKKETDRNNKFIYYCLIYFGEYSHRHTHTRARILAFTHNKLYHSQIHRGFFVSLNFQISYDF